MHTHGGAAQLEVGSLPVSVSRPSALHCFLFLTHRSPGNVPNPTPGPLMSTPLVNTGQPTLYNNNIITGNWNNKTDQGKAVYRKRAAQWG